MEADDCTTPHPESKPKRSASDRAFIRALARSLVLTSESDGARKWNTPEERSAYHAARKQRWEDQKHDATKRAAAILRNLNKIGYHEFQREDLKAIEMESVGAELPSGK